MNTATATQTRTHRQYVFTLRGNQVTVTANGGNLIDVFTIDDSGDFRSVVDEWINQWIDD